VGVINDGGRSGGSLVSDWPLAGEAVAAANKVEANAKRPILIMIHAYSLLLDNAHHGSRPASTPPLAIEGVWIFQGPAGLRISERHGTHRIGEGA